VTTSDAPDSGDFAAYLEDRTKQAQGVGGSVTEVRQQQPPGQQRAGAKPRQTIEDVLVRGEEPTEEFVEEFVALENAEPVSDEELERQALQDPGGDGDTRTPE